MADPTMAADGERRAELLAELEHHRVVLLARITVSARDLRNMAELRASLHADLREAADIGTTPKALAIASGYSESRIRQLLAGRPLEDEETG